MTTASESNPKPGPELASSETKSLWNREFIFIALINLTTFLGFYMTTTGLPVYVSSLGASDLIAGLVTTFTTLATLLIRPFSGMVLDRFGRKGILIIGLIAMVIVTSAYAVFPILAIILAIRLVHGIAWGLTSTATSTIAADLIPRKRFAEGMGYFALASSLAAAIAPALSIYLIQNHGVIPMIVLAVGSTLVALLLAFFQRPPQLERAVQNPKIQPADLFEKQALLPAAIAFLINCAFGAITTFIALHGQAQGVENIFMYFTVYAAVTLLTRPITGRIIDKKGFFGPGLVSAVGVVVTMVIIGFSQSLLLFCIAGVFGGIGIGTGMGTLQTMAVAAVPPTRRGVATSTYFFGFDAGIGIGAAIAGAIAGAIGYSSMFYVMAVFPALAALIFVLLGKNRIAAYSAQE